MYFTILLSSSLLLALVAAIPSSLPGTRIGISKTSRMLDDDGTVDIGWLIRQMMSLDSKYGWTMAAMTTNAFQVNNPDADVQAEAVVQLSALNSRVSGRPVPLTDDLNGELWQGSIMVGTPPVSYTVDFDTGSSDLFLPGRSCRTNCDGHNKYNPASSSSSRDLGKTFSLAYGDGSTVSGEQYSETVSIAGFSAVQQTIGSASQYSTGFMKSQFPADGLMGMGFKPISAYHANPVFQTLVAQGAVTDSVFAFKLATSGGELFIGGTNTSLYTPPIAYAAVSPQGYWQVGMDSVAVNGKTILSSLSAIIDTGTTLIVGTMSDVRQVYNAIPGAQDASSTIGEGYYTMPCSSIPTISLTFGGKAFSIKPALFNLGRVSSSGDCVGALVGSDVAKSVHAWILGDVFLRNVYTVFDVGNLRVGFARLS